MLVYPDMHNAFRLNLDKSSSLVGNPDFLPEEIDYWLNNAQDRFIKQRMFGNNSKGEGYQQSNKRISDLSNITVWSNDIINYSFGVHTLPLISSSIGSNVMECDLTNSINTYGTPTSTLGDYVYAPYMYFVYSMLYGNIPLTGGALNLIVDTEISFKEVGKYISTSINPTPFIRKPLVAFRQNAVYTYGLSNSISNTIIYFIYDSVTITPTSFSLMYIKQPKQLTSQTPTGYQTNVCELSPETHEEIVNIAVNLVIENIESPRIQSFNQINNSNIE